MSTGFHKSSSRDGFTLFELLIVLMLLGLFGSLLFSRLGDFLTDGDLRAASRTVIHQIQRFRAAAAYSRSDRYLGLDIDRNTMYAVDSSGKPVEEAGDGGSFQEIMEKPLPLGVRLEDVVILNRGKIQEGVARIRFSPDGSAERVLIHLRNTDDKVYTLQMNPFTGTVRVYERYVDEKAE